MTAALSLTLAIVNLVVLLRRHRRERIDHDQVLRHLRSYCMPPPRRL